jgi:hypothetical protein
MKIYSDKELTKEIDSKLFDLGIVKAGDTKQFEYFIKNDKKDCDYQNIQFACENKEISIISFPKSLKRNEIASLVVSWNPSVTLKSGLKTELKIEYWEIY